ncbi:LysR substrate-binding domain-containing protein [Glaciibacter psychrotolerans]|uniref:DNA-binding transcriptional LysR family regulator n=1 Tax=Glaciibacter psychrotolerans TaxID=670054 RepID=A0A7Z0J7H5_9MICO|nr:DNA-binding transcriptional LysR family regulator [Leifsonia psychrotolerans]
MTFSIAFVAGVTPTKWTRIWAERFPEIPLEVFRTDSANPTEQVTVLRDERADVSLVRFPVDTTGLGLINLYTEIPVVVAAKDHAIAAVDESGSVPLELLADEHLLQDPDTIPEWRDIATEVRDGSRRALPRMHDLDDLMEQVAAGVGIAILPHSLARLHNRKGVISRPVEGVVETQIALAWLAEAKTPNVEEFIGIVRGRSAASSRGATVVVRGEPVKKEKATAKAKAAAKLAREEAAKKKPAPAKKKPGAIQNRTRASAAARNKRRGSR